MLPDVAGVQGDLRDLGTQLRRGTASTLPHGPKRRILAPTRPVIVSRSDARAMRHALDQLAAKGTIKKAVEDSIVEDKGEEKCSGSTSLHSRQRLRFL